MPIDAGSGRGFGSGSSDALFVGDLSGGTCGLDLPLVIPPQRKKEGRTIIWSVRGGRSGLDEHLLRKGAVSEPSRLPSRMGMVV